MKLTVRADTVEVERLGFHVFGGTLALHVFGEDGDIIRVLLPDEVAEAFIRTQVPELVAWLSERDAARDRARQLAVGQTTVHDFLA